MTGLYYNGFFSGYGDIYPKSEGGQLFFMFYIALGIPLFFYLIWYKVRSRGSQGIARD